MWLELDKEPSRELSPESLLASNLDNTLQLLYQYIFVFFFIIIIVNNLLLETLVLPGWERLY